MVTRKTGPDEGRGHRAERVRHLAKMLGVRFGKIGSMVHIYPTYGDVVKRPAAQSYSDDLRNNPLVKLFMKKSG